VARSEDADLAAKVARLRERDAYPGRPTTLDAVETHMSWVFLTDRFAYKLKKPVCYEYLDFRTLAARRHFCDEELRLNAALAPGVYLGVVALARGTAGRLHLEGEGEPVEWLVKMRRLPAARMLDTLLRVGGIAPGDMRRIAETLAGFYRGCAVAETDGAAYRRRLEAGIRFNESIVGDPVFGLPAAVVAFVHLRLLTLLDQLPRLFDLRVAAGRIVEGHGDLRPEHVCLESRPLIYDRLEFHRDFRIVDTAEEVAALAMECERLGACAAGEELLRGYDAAAADRVAPALTEFYMAYRACVRARLAILHTRELAPAAWARWQQVATEYLHVAEVHVRRLPVQLCSSSTSEPPP
jgi:aminoglycoside phosphotransferase family enzyme